MRFLKVAVGVMSVLIVVATTVLVVVIVRRLGEPGPAPAAALAVVLNEPAGTRIAGISMTGDRLVLQLQGGGSDRLLLIDSRSGAVAGRIGLRDGGS